MKNKHTKFIALLFSVFCAIVLTKTFLIPGKITANTASENVDTDNEPLALNETY